MATKTLGTPHIYNGLSYMKGQFMISTKFVLDFSIVSLERYDFLTLNPRHPPFLGVFTVTITAKRVDDNMTYLW